MSSINGIGTTLYGKREVDQKDNSYITTEWFIFLFVPIFPIASYRVIKGKTESKFYLVTANDKTEYNLTKVKLNLRQVIRTYLLIWFPILIIILLIFYRLSSFR